MKEPVHRQLCVSRLGEATIATGPRPVDTARRVALVQSPAWSRCARSTARRTLAGGELRIPPVVQREGELRAPLQPLAGVAGVECHRTACHAPPPAQQKARHSAGQVCGGSQHGAHGPWQPAFSQVGSHSPPVLAPCPLDDAWGGEEDAEEVGDPGGMLGTGGPSVLTSLEDEQGGCGPQACNVNSGRDARVRRSAVIAERVL